jgi:hypothetical protein
MRDWLPKFEDVSMSWPVSSQQAEGLAKLIIPKYRPIRWWHVRRRLRDRGQEKKLYNELVTAMLEPIDPDGPNTSCFR